MKIKTPFLLSTLALSLVTCAQGIRGQSSPPTLTVLHDFSVVSGSHTNAEGVDPTAGLVQASDGNFYGVANSGGPYDGGTIFKMTPSGALTVLHAFSAIDGNGNNADGRYPQANLILGSDGNFYGTAYDGGLGHRGSVFKITPTGSFTTLHLFDAGESYGPYAPLAEDGNGIFYGTTQNAGGTDANGGIFKVTSTGSFSSLYAFERGSGSPSFPNGASPHGGLLLGSDGNLYGTTTAGGAGQSGTVFKFDPSLGTLTTLAGFSGASGADGPFSDLTPGSDGNYYGTTYVQSATVKGSIFKMTPSGAVTVLYAFNGNDGSNPVGTLFLGSDGNFYGTTYRGGTNGNGAIFKITPTGTLTTLHNFGAVANDGSNGDGAWPYGGVIEGSDGNFYGTTITGGAYGEGTVFKLAGLSVVTSPATAVGYIGKPFSYQITATNSPTTYVVQNLPSDLTHNGDSSPIISGTPTNTITPPSAVRIVTLNLSVINAAGRSGPYPLAVTIYNVPTITSPDTASAKVGQSFSYQITATQNPTSYGVGGLIGGFSVNQQTGLFTGTANAGQLGTHTFDLSAINGAGTGHETLTLTITN